MLVELLRIYCTKGLIATRKSLESRIFNRHTSISMVTQKLYKRLFQKILLTYLLHITSAILFIYLGDFIRNFVLLVEVIVELLRTSAFSSLLELKKIKK